MPFPTNALLTGPSTVAENTSSTNFTITPSVPITGTYTMGDGGFGGTFTPPSLTWAASSAPQTFVYNAPNHPGMTQIIPVWSGGGITTNPPYLLITITGANAAQHIYKYPQFGGVPPFQILITNDQIPGANVVFTTKPQHAYQYPQVAEVPPFGVYWTNNQIPAASLPTVTYTQSISPTSALVPATAVLTYTLSGVLLADIHITPVATHGSFSPTSVTITAGSLTGTTTLSDSVVGVSTISSTNDQSLTNPANITFTGLGSPPVTTCRGTMEAGGCIVISITSGASYVLMGPIATPFRGAVRETVFASGTGTFNLDYQFTTDQGVTWQVGKQVASSTTTADGTANTQTAHLKILPGVQWQIIVYNTSVGAINVSFEKRLFSRGKRGN